MPKNFTSYLQSRELAGIFCGLGVTVLSPDRRGWLSEPTVGLSVFALVAMLAAFLVSGVIVRAGHSMEIAVRRGTGAGAFALLAAGSFFLWDVRDTSDFFPLRAWMIFGASVMPALLAASFSAWLAARWLRRPVEPPPQLGELPGIVRWSARWLIGVGFLMALAAPWLPRSAPPRAVTVPPPKEEKVVAPPVVSQPPPPPRVQFEYKTPADLKTASPVAWKVKTSRRLGAMTTERGVAFSPNQRYLAWGESDSTIVVHDLESEDVRRVSGIPYPVLSMVFSPDAERLFVVMRGEPLRVGVGFLDTGRFVILPQPKKHAVPEGTVSWWKEDEVVFVLKSGSPRVLSLDTLEMDVKELSPTELEKIRSDQTIGFPVNERWAFGYGSMLTFSERPEVEGTREWKWQSISKVVLTDMQRVSRRIFFEISPTVGDTYFGVRDGSKLMQIRDGGLSVFYFETGPVPPLRWKITMPHGPEKMREKELVENALAKGSLSLLMYSPLINPLNGKIVGPDRERPKAILRVGRWEGTEAEVGMEVESGSYSPKDVFADLHIPGEPPRLVATDQPHPWWIQAPEPLPDASDPAMIPLRKVVANEQTEPPAQPGDEESDDVIKSVSNFVIAHHAAATAGRLKDVVNDYASRVDHFNNGVVDRDFILKDETEYHQKYRYVREEVVGSLAIKRMSTGKVEVRYEMTNEWQRLADNVAGGARFRIILLLEEDPPAGWRIIRHKSDKQN